MIKTGKIELAKQLSKHFHKGQKYGGHDYYEYHITGVVNTLELVAKEVTEDMIIVALLHDVLEDTECAWETLENIFDYDIADYIECLSYVKELAQKYQNDIDERAYVALLNYKVDIND